MAEQYRKVFQLIKNLEDFLTCFDALKKDMEKSMNQNLFVTIKIGNKRLPLTTKTAQRTNLKQN